MVDGATKITKLMVCSYRGGMPGGDTGTSSMQPMVDAAIIVPQPLVDAGTKAVWPMVDGATETVQPIVDKANKAVFSMFDGATKALYSRVDAAIWQCVQWLLDLLLLRQGSYSCGANG